MLLIHARRMVNMRVDFTNIVEISAMMSVSSPVNLNQLANL